MQHLRRMEDRVVMLTGGGGGIARGVARAFADEGASLILTDIFPDGMERTKRELEEDYGAKVLILLADGSKENEIKAAVEAVPPSERPYVLSRSTMSDSSMIFRGFCRPSMASIRILAASDAISVILLSSEVKRGQLNSP